MHRAANQRTSRMKSKSNVCACLKKPPVREGAPCEDTEILIGIPGNFCVQKELGKWLLYNEFLFVVLNID
jgi:hypothetical protein